MKTSNPFSRLINHFKSKERRILFAKLSFIVIGISSTIWFLVRVIPKPSRAFYPCMQASAPLMSAFVMYLLTFYGAIGAFLKTKAFITKRKYGFATLFGLLTLVCVAYFTLSNSDRMYASVISAVNPPKMIAGINEPVGEAKGIFPGRVVWVYEEGAANWDEKTGFWYEDRWNPQEKSNKMISEAITSLTGETTQKKAWKKLFVHFNQNNQRGNSGYQKDEKIAIKLNLNNTSTHENKPDINASPQLVYALLNSLVKEAGVPQKNITVFDASRGVMNFLFEKCHADFPEVVFVDNIGGDGRTKSEYKEEVIPFSVDNGKLARGLATCANDADYLINMALLKGHPGMGVTLCGKNWYGATSISTNPKLNAHNNFAQDREGKAKYVTYTDYMGHKDMGGKTFIYFIDGLYASKSVGSAPNLKWNMTPFNGSWPCSLFASQDPVAIDAVGIDFLVTEWPDMPQLDYCDAYLQEAALAENPPSGTFYDPERDSVRMKSLGVFEHWNDPVNKQYSRNLGKKSGIELIQISN